MKTLIQIVVVALIAGGLSAAGSFYLLQTAKKTTPEVTAPESKVTESNTDESVAGNDDAADDTMLDHEESLGPVMVNPPPAKSMTSSETIFLEPPAAIRPPYLPESDEAGSLINKLRTRDESTTNRERRLFDRQELMELVLDDLRFEQTNSAKTRQKALDATNMSMQTIEDARKETDMERNGIRDQRIELRRNAEERIQIVQREKELVMKSAEEALRSARSERDAAEEALKEARIAREELQKQLNDLTNPPEGRDPSGLPENNSNLKKLASVLDGMPPENTASILQQMVKKGSTEGGVAILNAMKPRIAAKVLSAITEEDAELAADLTERLKQVKQK